MALGTYLKDSIWSTPFVVWNKKAKWKGHGPTLEEARPDHAIRSSVAITKLPLGRDIRKNRKKKKKKNNNKKEKCEFLKIFFLRILLKLSGLVIIYTASLLVQEHSKSILWRNFV